MVRKSGELKQKEGRVAHPRQLPAGFRLMPEEQRFFRARRDGLLPFALTRHILSLIDPADPEDPIRRQFFPRVEELSAGPWESEDPLGEQRFRAAPGLLHRYPDRALLLVTDRCAAYCRHCFRRRLAARGPGPESGNLDRVSAYLRGHPEVRELILSGGDPLALSDERLERILARMRGARPELAFRIHTRMPVVLPQRITLGLTEELAGYKPLRLVTQYNHPRELAPESLEAVRRLLEAGVPVLNQSVLLKGVNDRPEVLADLFRGLVRAGIRPYYLFQPDLASGTAHFRPSLERGLTVFTEASRLCRPEELPRYVLDLPGGGGKVPLSPALLRNRVGGAFVLDNGHGETSLYPDES